PVVRELTSAARRSAVLAVAALAIFFSIQAVDIGINDAFSPLDYALYCAKHPGYRMVWGGGRRAGFIVDRVAGPHEAVAVDGSFDTWIYPAMGARQTRRIEFIGHVGGRII